MAASNEPVIFLPMRAERNQLALKGPEDLACRVGDLPLLKLDETLESIHPSLYGQDLSMRSLCFGFGLCTGSTLSKGLPADALGMLCAALLLAERLGIGRVIFWVGDVNARHNALLQQDKIEPLAQEYLGVIRRALMALGTNLPVRTTTFMGSDFDRDVRHARFEEKFLHLPNRYLRRQIADMDYLHRHHDMVLKLSWSMGGDRSRGHAHRDERWFDDRFLAEARAPLSFAFIQPGRTFSRHRPRCAPYISQPDEARVLLRPGQDIDALLAGARAEGGKRIQRKCEVHLEHTLNLWRMVGGKLPDERHSLAERWKAVIEQLTSMPKPDDTPGLKLPTVIEDRHRPLMDLCEGLGHQPYEPIPRMTT